MPPIELLLTFFLTTAIFAFIPGPAMLYAAAQTLSRGRSGGLMASLGIHVGGYTHVVAAAAGLSVLFETVPTIYLAVKFVGAAYLVWLGICLFRTKMHGNPVVGQASKSGRRAFLESVTTEILNPKTAIFYAAFLPQFVDSSGAFPVWLQFVILGALVNGMFSIADIACVLLASTVTARLKRSGRVQQLLQRAGGAVLIGLGVHVAFHKS
jgi:threonine/homoserine/homoserine lactone efflux protein